MEWLFNPDNLISIQGLVFLLVVAIIWVGGGRARPRAYLRFDEDNGRAIPFEAEAMSEDPVASRPDKYAKALAVLDVEEASPRLDGRSRISSHASSQESSQESSSDGRFGGRSLNVFFNWNGHTWDAHEVLGLPAGASRDKVIQAFHSARARAGRDSLPFLQAAADAILKRSA